MSGEIAALESAKAAAEALVASYDSQLQEKTLEKIDVDQWITDCVDPEQA